ncbi:unnamed protein product [Trichobilharzia regenti]|nr:unnamed protein product [Trichobilharzia regenti]
MNVLSDFEEMTSGSSSVVILTDEVDQDEVDNTVITGGYGVWGDDDDSENEVDDIDHSTDNDKNKTTSAAKAPTKETVSIYFTTKFN